MISVILMAYGSPTRMEDVKPYLEGIYGEKPVPEYALKENTEKYSMAGGISPSNAIIDSIVRKLQDKLSGHGDYHVSLGNKHWEPFLSEALNEVNELGADKVIAMPLFPFASTNVKNSYLEPTIAAMKKMGVKAEVKFVNGFRPEQLSEMWADMMKNYPIDEGTGVLFDAHSLPLFGGTEDEYDAAFRRTASRISEMMGIPEHFVGYQSRGRYGKTWLEPSVYDMLDLITTKGYREVLAVPIGFIYEHLEILYDLDHEFGERVRNNGLIYIRSELPNDSERFISILGDHVLEESGDRIGQS